MSLLNIKKKPRDERYMRGLDLRVETTSEFYMHT